MRSTLSQVPMAIVAWEKCGDEPSWQRRVRLKSRSRLTLPRRRPLPGLRRDVTGGGGAIGAIQVKQYWWDRSSIWVFGFIIYLGMSAFEPMVQLGLMGICSIEGGGGDGYSYYSPMEENARGTLSEKSDKREPAWRRKFSHPPPPPQTANANGTLGLRQLRLPGPRRWPMLCKHTFRPRCEARHVGLNCLNVIGVSTGGLWF